MNAARSLFSICSEWATPSIASVLKDCYGSNLQTNAKKSNALQTSLEIVQIDFDFVKDAIEPLPLILYLTIQIRSQQLFRGEQKLLRFGHV